MTMAIGSESPGPVTVLRGHEGDVQCCDFVNDDVLATGDIHGICKLWSLEKRRAVVTQRLHDPLAGVLSLQHLGACEAPRLISSGRDGTVKIWDLERLSSGQGMKMEDPVMEFQTGVYSFCQPRSALIRKACPPNVEDHLNEESRREPEACSSSVCETILDATQVVSHTSRPHLNATAPLVPHDNGILVLTAGTSAGGVNVWDMRTPVVRPCLSLCDASDTTSSSSSCKFGMCMALSYLSQDGTVQDVTRLKVIAGYEDGSVAVWDVRRPHKNLEAVRGHTEPVMCLTVAPGSCLAASGAADSKLCCWSLPTSVPTLTCSTKSSLRAGAPCHGEDLRPVGVTTIGSCTRSAGAICKDDDSTHLLSLVSGDLQLSQPGCNGLDFSPDGRMLASAGWDGKVRLFKTPRQSEKSKKRNLLGVLEYHQSQVTAVRFRQLHEEYALISTSRDKCVALWALQHENC
ncbi:hypothetical protein CEUSTIGMA_g11388.t1 [Chlamydomonas eustigma]|uniref:Anaphase-promoting complex subunit 4 WD40 domain-containing protein n=1 Tax=Chlamydomonas eustigma TaxID=1157962 RepID=A0A250XLL8_9CHLO|nr:hypothetical protein CEUSTIGMA_g11388.t1 [Chlamydomonas eustigma]|eukprot:GAX83964.1 hypothetical protein CEUSTIGMA_g11388.t1 [Chlamydomonas eustigma]